MRKHIFLIFGLLILVASCTQVRTLSTGLDNEGYLEFIYTNPDQKYEAGVDVTIDDNAPFKAVVNKDKAKSSKGSIYKIATGTRIVSVSYNGTVIYRKQIFISSQQTIKIKL